MTTKAADEKTYTDREVERLVNHAQGSSYMLGIASGWEEASQFVLKKAGEYFTLGNDDAADRYRRLSTELMDVHKDRRIAYDEREAEWDRTADAREGSR